MRSSQVSYGLVATTMEGQIPGPSLDLARVGGKSIYHLGLRPLRRRSLEGHAYLMIYNFLDDEVLSLTSHS